MVHALFVIGIPVDKSLRNGVMSDGDPTNIMIDSYTGLSFIEFVKNPAPTCISRLGDRNSLSK